MIDMSLFLNDELFYVNNLSIIKILVGNELSRTKIILYGIFLKIKNGVIFFINGIPLWRDEILKISVF